jgi:DNA polymerase-3 subunit beta
MTTATVESAPAPTETTTPSDLPPAVYAIGRLRATITRAQLADALTLAASVATAKRAINPALACCRIVAGDNEVTVEATNLEAAVISVVSKVQVESQGAVLVSIDKLAEIVNEHTEETLAIEVENKSGVPTLFIRGSESEFKLFLSDLNKFPEITPAEESPALTIHATTLARLIKQTEIAIPDGAKRGVLQGILLESDGKTLTAVGCDGSRLAVATTPMPDAPKLSANIPDAALKMVKGLLSMMGDESLEVSIDGNRIVFDADSVVITHVTLEGQFPPYADALKSNGANTKGKLTVNRESLVAAVRKARIVSKESEDGLWKMRCDFGPSGLELGGSSSMFGEGTVRLPCKVEGQTVVVGLNPVFFLDGLNATNAPEVRIDLPADPSRPIFIRDADSFTYMQMPVNLK